jgi:tetratricopeptide (TPR) repeat protein
MPHWPQTRDENNFSRTDKKLPMKSNQDTSNPDDEHFQLPLGLTPSERLEEAVRSIRELLASNPDDLRLLNQLGAIYLSQGRPVEGIPFLERSLSVSPDQFVVLSDYASGLGMLGRFQASIEVYDRVIALNPSYVMAHYNRGLVLQILKRPEEALESFERAIALDPNCAPAHNNRGNILKSFGRLSEALESYDRVIELNPSHAEAHNNRGTVMHELLRLPEALENYEQAISLTPFYATAYMNKALLKLLEGNDAEGWQLYEWRWKADQKNEYRNFAKPLWLGEKSIANQTLLIQAEQGFGDILQFCRYVPMLQKMGTRVILEAPQPLISILSTLPGEFAIVEKGTTLPDFDCYCPIMSLPLALKTTLENIPSKVPYLFADSHKIAAWQERLGSKKRPRVGLAWSGKTAFINDRNRSLALEHLIPLLKLPFEFHSLQVEYRKSDPNLLKSFPQIHDHHNLLRDFADTAALISEMDLIVSVDTSVAHLSGALGKHLWILLPYAPNFRWRLDRTDSPWYPTAVLFRQPVWGDWTTVISNAVSRMEKEFKEIRGSLL